MIRSRCQFHAGDWRRAWLDGFWTFVSLGDVCDPFPLAADHVKAQCLADLATCRSIPLRDVNGNGVVNLADIAILRRIAAGLPVPSASR